jgi:hypothetical protein
MYLRKLQTTAYVHLFYISNAIQLLGLTDEMALKHKKTDTFRVRTEFD